ncbi:ribonuclease H-like domain-containing protein [Tanacetum coccineum]
MHGEFEMSMMGELNFFLGLQIKQMEDGIFFNQSKYIKEMLKKFGLEDSKPTKTSMSTKIKLTKDDEADSMDSSKFRGEDEFHDDNPPPPPAVTPTQQAPHNLSTIKLPILKKEILARERERKARTTLLMSIPEDHLAKFHKMTDAKEMWEAINQILWCNDESKKMQKYILKRQFESFSVSPLKMPIRSFLDLYLLPGPKLHLHHLPVQNVAFVSSESTSSTNDVSTAYGVSTSSGHNSQKEGSSSYTDELKYSFFANQSSGPQLDHEDLEQKFYKNTGRKLQFDAKEPVGFDKTKVECFNCHNTGHFARECRSKGNQESRRRDAGNTGYKAKDNGRRPRKQEEPKALVTIDGEYEQREQLGDVVLEFQPYTQALKKVEAQLVCHQQNQLVYEEKIRFMKIDLDDKTNVLTYHKKLLAEAVKEKEELKTKLENFQSSSKGLSKLLNSQMSAKDKSGLGYGDQIHEGVLSYENEVLESVFDSRSSDVEDSPVYDRFAKVEGMHAVPPPMTGIYMPPKSDFGIDESNFTYGPK